jgi:2-furoyl-CoA dehydrogenase 2Fe-2S iron sulfur subunit
MLRIRVDEKRRIEMTVNGRRSSGYAEARTLLSDFLRHELGLYGVHVGCEHGVCGACTVIVGGRAVRSCTQRAIEAEGAEVLTVEGLVKDGRLSDLQEAFRRHHALQCGFCTAGVLMSATNYLKSTPTPNEEQVREMLSGHICRCTGYVGMVEAILEVAQAPRREAKAREE